MTVIDITKVVIAILGLSLIVARYCAVPRKRLPKDWWSGEGMETQRVQNKIDELRDGHLERVNAGKGQRGTRRERITRARRKLRNLPFFDPPDTDVVPRDVDQVSIDNRSNKAVS